jgi:dimethylhistidine N-methyltransferase
MMSKDNGASELPSAALVTAVRSGLLAPKKSLPPFLFYDARGSALFEQITLLPEYYLTRTERSILERDAACIATTVLSGLPGPVAVLELGAGTATKTEVLLRAFTHERKDITFLPADVSPSPLEEARKRLARTLPDLLVKPIVGTHGDALSQMSRWEGTVVVLFIGSSIGNYEDADAAQLLLGARGAMGKRGVLVLGVDHKKSLQVLLPAYDDGAGVTAAFNLNVLARLNRELGADFDLGAFRHVALWNEAAGAMEMHLESTREQVVSLAALSLQVSFTAGERIHTESSHKYDQARVRRLLSAAGLRGVAAFEDERHWFGLHVATAALDQR